MNFELNNAIALDTNTLESVKRSPGVEILSAIVNGKDVSRFDGKHVDAAYNHLKTLGQRAVNGDDRAKMEINQIRTVMIEAPLMQRLRLLDFMGNVTRVGYNEEVRYKVFELQGKMSGSQAGSGSFPFPTAKYRTETLETKEITGGIVTDWREIAAGNTDAMAFAQEQVITDMMNKMFKEIMVELYNSIKGAAINNFAEADGIGEEAVKEALKKARRFGDVSILGDYSVITQLEDFTGWSTDSTTKMFSDAVMEEVRKTGKLSTFRKSPVIEIPNTFEMTKLNSAKDFYETYLPEGLLFFLPQGEANPLQIGLRGGLTSMTGTDINLRAEVQRFDIEFGTKAIKEHIPAAGLISDNNYEVDKR